MEAIAAVSSVAGVLALIVQVTTLSCRYVSSVKNSSKAIKGYFHELETLKYVLRRCEDLLSEPRTAGHASLAVRPEVLNNFELELKLLLSKLRKRTSENAFTSSMRKMSWPIVEDETRQLVEKLSRYRSDIVALFGLDHFALSAQTHEAVEVVQSGVDTIQKQSNAAWLSPIDESYNQDLARGKHQDHTGDWLLESDDFVHWMRGLAQNFWICGRPGTGKTILCSTVIDFLQPQDSKRVATVYFYFDFSDGEKQTVKAAMRSMLSQLTSRLDISPHEVLEIYRKTNAYINGRAPSLKGLAYAFKAVVQRFERVNVILDALDESSEREKMLEIIVELSREPSQNLHFIVTSRPQRDVLDALDKALVASLDENPLVEADVALYIRYVLDRDNRLKRRPSTVKKAIEDALVGKAGGVFRWAECQLDVLRKCPTVRSVEKALASLPQSLEKTYERMLSSIRPEHNDHVIRALRLLCFSYKPMYRPIRIAEIAEIAVIDPSEDQFDRGDYFYDPEDIIEICSGLVYVVPGSGCVRLAHSSVKDYLLSDQIRQSPAARFGVTKHEAQVLLAEACLSYLMTFKEPGTKLADYMEDFPFLEYATNNWYRHVRLGGDKEQSSLLRRIIAFFDSHKSSAFANWRSSFPSDCLLDCDIAPTQEVFSPLYLMAYFRCYQVLPALTISKTPVHVHGLDCGPSLGLAIWGDVELLQYLIDAGCDLGCQLATGESISAFAARVGSVEIIKLLLDADIETTGTETNLSMLTVATIFRRRNVIDLILETGADLFEADHVFGSSLHAAVVPHRLDHGHQYEPEGDIVKVLLDWGAEVNHISMTYGTPIHAAVTYASLRNAEQYLLEVIRLLLAAGADTNLVAGQLGTPLQAALVCPLPTQKKDQLVRLLLSAGSRVDIVAGKYGTMLQAAATRESSADLATLMLQLGADVNKVAGYYGTALQAAAYAQNIATVLNLLKAGANINLYSGFWGSALQAACATDGSEDHQMVRILLDHGADVNQLPPHGNGLEGTALQNAARNGNVRLVDLLLNRDAQVNAEGKYGGPALHACMLGFQAGSKAQKTLETAKSLLAAHADCNQIGGCYSTALVAASATSSLELVSLLLNAGADVNIVANESLTSALHAAAAHPNSFRVIKALLRAGAFIGAKDREGRTASDVARQSGNIAAVGILIDTELNAQIGVEAVDQISSSLLPHASGSTAIYQNLAERASADPHLQKLVGDVESSNASQEQLDENRIWFDEMNVMIYSDEQHNKVQEEDMNTRNGQAAKTGAFRNSSNSNRRIYDFVPILGSQEQKPLGIGQTQPDGFTKGQIPAHIER